MGTTRTGMSEQARVRAARERSQGMGQALEDGFDPAWAGAALGSAPDRPWARALRQLAGDPVSRVVFAVVALVVGFGYSLLLPFAFTQQLSLANWRYLDARYVGFSVAFALGMGWVIALQVFAVRRLAREAFVSRAEGGAGPFGVVAAAVSLLPSLLCCSPIIPTLVGLFGMSVTARLQTTGRLTYFFASNENLLLAGSLALLVVSGLWSLRKLARASCLDDACCTPPVARHGREVGRSEEPPLVATARNEADA